jgi:hypothetical protein
MSAAPQHAPAASTVLLVIAGPAVSHAAIARTAELAAGSVVTVIGVGSEHPPGAARPDQPARTPPVSGRAAGRDAPAVPPGAVPEQVRRTVALAISVLDDAGVTALGRIALTGSPARAIARAARARGVRVVVLDEAGPLAGPADSGLAAELRRRMYGSGIVVMAPNDRGGRWVVPS